MKTIKKENLFEGKRKIRQEKNTWKYNRKVILNKTKHWKSFEGDKKYEHLVEENDFLSNQGYYDQFKSYKDKFISVLCKL